MKRTAVFLTLALSVLLTLSAALAQADYDEWLEWAQLGEYQPETEDWDDIYARAQEEPPLLVYANTSNIFKAVEDLTEQYPGIEIEPLDIKGQVIIDRIVLEWDAGLRDVGVAFMALPWLQHDLLLPRGAITRYVPREHEAAVGATYTEPLPVHRFSASGWMYNDDNFDEAPWENIWELTTEKFRNRVAMSDIGEGATTPTHLTGLVQHSDEMERLYEEYFGEPLELHSTTNNAGEEFVRRLLANDMRVLSSSREVAEAITNSTGPFAGMTVYSRLREVNEGTYQFNIDLNSPVVVSYHYVSIGSFSESPNTAKLLIRHLLSEEGGAPWWGENFPANSDYELTPPYTLTLADFTYGWPVDADTAIDVMDDLFDYWPLWRQ